MLENLHECKVKETKEGIWGIAVDLCREDMEGNLWVGNGEYENTVNYCPFCGYVSKKLLEI